jgi:polyhydroxybutyrate depolymerase
MTDRGRRRAARGAPLSVAWRWTGRSGLAVIRRTARARLSRMRSVAIAIILAACGSTASPPPRTFGGDRPVNLEVPRTLEDGKRYPLVVVLHGYGANGYIQEVYFGLSQLASEGTAFVIAPDGLTDAKGKQFWNADPNCCDFDHRAPDDVAYLGGLIDEISAAWPIDPKAVFLVGHSNGGFMAYRLACDRADVVTNIVALAGEAASTTCAPSQPVHVLHIHGTMDDSVPFAVAAPSVQKWAGYDQCATTRAAGPALDLDTALAGTETRTEASTACPPGAAADLWTIDGAGHIPVITDRAEPVLWKWLTDHRRP